MTELKNNDSNTSRSLLKIATYLFIGSIVFSLSGSLFLKLFPASLEFFGPYYETLVKAPTWMYMTMLLVISLLMFAPQNGWRKVLIACAWGMVIGGASELIGTSTGFPYGTYFYTTWLGPKIMDHVPYFIPMSWFALSIVSYDLAGRISTSPIKHIGLATAFMVLWDVCLDPPMSKAFPFWIYPEGGFYYGMPLSNWLGWILISFIIMCGYRLIFKEGIKTHAWSLPFYTWNYLFPIGLSLLYGLYGAAFVGLIALLIPMGLLMRADKVQPMQKVPA